MNRCGYGEDSNEYGRVTFAPYNGRRRDLIQVDIIRGSVHEDDLVMAVQAGGIPLEVFRTRLEQALTE